MAGLQVEVFQATAGPPEGAVILCHGFGAPGTDLVDLGPALVRAAPALHRVRFYFPAAPLSLGEMGWGDARAWWLIDMAALQAAGRDEKALQAFRRVEPDGMPAARRALLALVQQVANETGLPLARLALGGFSQGSMLATDVALRLEEAPAGLCILSGTLLLEEVWQGKAKARTSMPVFQSHGRQDPILPFRAAEALRTLLVEAGLSDEFVPFDGGHTITAAVVDRLAAFLAKHLLR